VSGFTKLSSSIVLSTVWGEPHHIRIVWITLLALADANGYVGGSIPGLAATARVTLEECEQALAAFLAPDRYSRTKAHEGRRIEEVDGGWVLLNHALYRAGRDPEARRLQNREAQARKRERNRQQPSAADVADAADRADGQPESAQAEAEAEADQHPSGVVAAAPLPARPKARKRKPNATSRPEDWQPTKAHHSYSAKHGIDVETEVARFKPHHDSRGNLFVDWNAAFTTWLATEVKYQRQRAPAPGLVEHAERTGSRNVEKPGHDRSRQAPMRVASAQEAASPDYQAAIPTLSDLVRNPHRVTPSELLEYAARLEEQEKLAAAGSPSHPEGAPT
jgi:hypothetical protein